MYSLLQRKLAKIWLFLFLNVTLWLRCTVRKSKVLTVFVNGGDCSVPVNVTFRPTAAERCMADIYISIRHNIYEDSIVQLVGEGYIETVTIDDISCTDDFDPPLMPPPTAAAAVAGDEDEEDDTPGY